MKKLLIIILGMTLLLPLYAQEATDHVQIDSVQDTPGSEGEYTAEQQYDQEEGFEDDFELAERKPKDYTRQKWELGLLSNIGVGFDNDIIGTSEIFQKNVVIDVDKIKDSLIDGAHVNFDLSLDILHLDIKNIAIKEGIWDFGFFINANGGIGLFIDKSIFTLLSEGNLNSSSFNGDLASAAGGVFAAAGFSGAAQYEVGGKNLRVGIKPALFAPLVYIPKSGINYNLDTKHKFTDGGKEEEGILFTSSGDIRIYSPFFEDSELKFGFDISLEGEYALFDFLDVGATFTQIPFIPAAMEQYTRYTLIMDDITIKPGDLLDDDKDDGNFDFDFEDKRASGRINAMRPMRFDVYGKFRPLALNSNNTHNPELLVLVPNIGFSVDFAGEQGFFNTGIAIQTTLNNNMFTASLYSGYEEGSWRHQLGIIFNLRAVELHLNAAIRSPNFAGAFTGQGFGVNIGMCYGW